MFKNCQLEFYLLFVLFCLPLVYSANITWTGSDGNWEDAFNWSDGAVPGTFDTAIIPSHINASVKIRDDRIVDALFNDATIEISPEGNSIARLTVMHLNSSGTWVLKATDEAQAILNSVSSDASVLSGPLFCPNGTLQGKWLWEGDNLELVDAHLEVKGHQNSSDGFLDVPGGLILNSSRIHAYAPVLGLRELYSSTLMIADELGQVCPENGLYLEHSTLISTFSNCTVSNYTIYKGKLLTSSNLRLENSIIELSSVQIDNHGILTISGPLAEFMLDDTWDGMSSMGLLSSGTLEFENFPDQVLPVHWMSSLVLVGTQNVIKFRRVNLILEQLAFPGANIIFDQSNVSWISPAPVRLSHASSINTTHTFHNYTTRLPIHYDWQGSTRLVLFNSGIVMSHDRTTGTPSNTLPSYLSCQKMSACDVSVMASPISIYQSSDTEIWNTTLKIYSNHLVINGGVAITGNGKLWFDERTINAGVTLILGQTDSSPYIDIPIAGESIDIVGGGYLKSFEAVDANITIWNVDEPLSGTYLDLTYSSLSGHRSLLQYGIDYSTIALRNEILIEQGVSVHSGDLLDIRGTIISFNLTREGWNTTRMPQLLANNSILFTTALNLSGYSKATEFVIAVSQEMLESYKETGFQYQTFFYAKTDPDIPVRFVAGIDPLYEISNCLWWSKHFHSPGSNNSEVSYQLSWTPTIINGSCTHPDPPIPPTEVVIKPPSKGKAGFILGITLAAAAGVILIPLLIISLWCCKISAPQPNEKAIENFNKNKTETEVTASTSTIPDVSQQEEHEAMYQEAADQEVIEYAKA